MDNRTRSLIVSASLGLTSLSVIFASWASCTRREETRRRDEEHERTRQEQERAIAKLQAELDSLQDGAAPPPRSTPSR